MTAYNDAINYNAAIPYNGSDASGGGSYRPYRYISADEPLRLKKKRVVKFTYEDEEELKRLILESEENQRQEVAILEKRSNDLFQKGIELDRIRSEVDYLKVQLEAQSGRKLAFDVTLQLRILQLKRKRRMALLLLLDSA